MKAVKKIKTARKEGNVRMVYWKELMAYFMPSFIVCVIYLVISEIYLWVRREQASWLRRIFTILFGVYLAMIFAITVSPVYGFLRVPFGNHINLVPFEVVKTLQSAPLNFFGNIGMFIPLGFMLVMLSKKCWQLHTTMMFGAGLSLLIELIQLWETRGTDIDDLILNSLGTFLGYCLAVACLKNLPGLRRKVGIVLLKTRKVKKKDLSGIILLMPLILGSVFLVGFSQMNHNIVKSPTENNQQTLMKLDTKDKRISENIELTAKNAILLNETSNTVLYEKNSEEKIPTASTAKMLTALTVLDYCKLNEEVFIGKESQMIEGDASRVWLQPGNKLTVEQLLNALLLPSGNDAAFSLAVYTGRKISDDENSSIEDAMALFIEAMNEKAVKLGAVHSKFLTPDGYDTFGQYSTAYDLGQIAKEFCKSKVLLEIAGTYRISDVWLSGEQVTHYNTNELINPESQYYFKDAVGLKTGTSEAAGCCLVSAAYINKQLFLCVVMGSTEEGRWLDSLSLYRAIRN